MNCAAYSTVINSIVEAGVSIKRIRSFLLSAEHQPVGPNNLQDIGVRMQAVSAAYDSKKPKLAETPLEAREKDTEDRKQLNDREWEIALLRSQLRHAEQQIRELSGLKASEADMEEDPPENLLALKRIDFECKQGELVAVVGGVGCGKSSFINAILGEVRQLAGTTSVKGNLAYFSQAPFIMNATVRDNILFSHVGSDVNEELYQRALDCCALRHDLTLLPYGDATEIGEKGITLSGGQRARVSLSRAVYHQADITLMIDDALSAVDAHVAEHLFEEAIVKELMKGEQGRKRSVILVTNAIQYLNHPSIDKIVVLQDGRVAEQGSYEELVGKPGSLFSRFLAVMEDTGVSSDAMGSCVAEEEGVATEDEAKIGSATRRRSSTARRRRSSVKEVLKPQKLMTEETRAKGHVGLDVYMAWSKAAGGLVVPIFVFLIFAGDAGIQVLTKWWLTYWSSHGDSGSSQNYFLVSRTGDHVSIC